MRKILATLIVTSLSSMLCACGSGGSSTPTPQPKPKATVHVSLDSHTLAVPSARNKSMLGDAPATTHLTLHADDLSGPVTVNVVDEHTSSNSLKLSRSSCTLSQNQTSCTIAIQATAEDRPGSTDNIQINATGSSQTVSVDQPSETITFESSTPPTPQASVTVSVLKNSLVVPAAGTSSPGSSTQMTITGINVTKNINFSVSDAKRDGNTLNLSSNHCQLTSTAPTCTLTVSATADDQADTTDSLSFKATDSDDTNLEVNPNQETFSFTKATPPPQKASIHVSSQKNTLVLPTQGTPSSESSTKMTISGVNVTQDIAVSIIDERHNNNSLGLSPKSCILTTAEPSCSVTVTATANDQVNTTDSVSILANDSIGNTITVTPAQETFTFIAPTPQPSNVTYSLDATNVGGDSTHPVAYITGVNQVSYPAKNENFYIKNGSLYAKGTPPSGLYQINVKATKGNEVAYSTFYVMVSQSTTPLALWRQGGPGSAATANVLKLSNNPVTMIYSYTHADPSKSLTQFNQVYQSYADDLNYINNNPLRGHSPINAIAAEFPGPSYNGNDGYWKVDSSQTDIKKQINSSAARIGYDNLDFMPGFISNSIKKDDSNLTLSPDLTFGQSIRASYSNFNPSQLNVIDKLIMQYATTADGKPRPGISGISFDLERGTDSNDTAAFKTFADHLAYKGMFFGYYEFADKAFQPSVVAAMGPMGIAFISSYDVGSKRATKEGYDSAYRNFGEYVYNKIFAHNISCGTKDGTRYSWCNLSSNDSLSANTIAWSQSKNLHHITTEQTMSLLNGNYSITLPVGESSTDFSYQEIFNPDFSDDQKGLDNKQAGLAVTHTGNCRLLKQGADNSQYWTKDNLDQCLFDDTASMIDGHGFVSYQHCGTYADGTTIPYQKCILISSNLSAVNNTLVNPTQADYIKENIKAYQSDDKHMVGYSLFALQNTESAPDGGTWLNKDYTTVNKAIQEPWYIGGGALRPSATQPSACTQNSSVPCDPFYSSEMSKHVIEGVWQAFSEIQK